MHGLSLPTDHAGAQWSPIDLLRTLPSEAELRHLPVVAEPGQLAMLQGTDAHSLATGLRLEVEETYRELAGLLVHAPSSPLQKSAITLSRWRWSRRRASAARAAQPGIFGGGHAPCASPPPCPPKKPPKQNSCTDASTPYSFSCDATTAA